MSVDVEVDFNDSKKKRRERIQQKENYLKKQLKIAKAYRIPVKMGEEHRLQKHSPMNCGSSDCVMCGNPRKFWHEKTIKEKSFEQTEKWFEE